MEQILETERLSLRRINSDDADFILKLLNEPSFLKNIGDKNVRSTGDARDYIQNGPEASYRRNGFGLYLVGLKETGEPIGMCGLLKRDELEDVDLGYAFLPAFWSKGYAVESAAGVMEYARKILGLSRIVAITVPVNTGSIRVLEKIGFRFEKTIRLHPEGEELSLFVSES